MDVRWDTEFIMLAVIFQLHVALRSLWTQGVLPRTSKKKKLNYYISDTQWDVMEQLLVVLSRAEMVTRALEGSQGMTLACVYPEIYSLFKFMKAKSINGKDVGFKPLKGSKWAEDEVRADVKTLKKRMVESLPMRFPGLRPDPIDKWPKDVKKAFKPHLIAMYLDPALSCDFHYLVYPGLTTAQMTANMKAFQLQAEEWVLEAALNAAKQWVPTPDDPTPSSNKPREHDDGGEGSDTDEEEERLRQAQAAMMGPASSASTASLSTAASEGEGGDGDAEGQAALSGIIEREIAAFSGRVQWMKPSGNNMSTFVKQMVTDWETDGGLNTSRCPELHWWYRNQGTFPHLAMLARIYLAIRGSSAAPERLFSKTGRLKSALRSSMTPHHLNMKVMIRDNYHPGLKDVSTYSTERKGASKVGEKRKADSNEGAGEGEGAGSAYIPPPAVVDSEHASQVRQRVLQQAMSTARQGLDDLEADALSGLQLLREAVVAGLEETTDRLAVTSSVFEDILVFDDVLTDIDLDYSDLADD